MNGINMAEWNPAADAHLPGPVQFDARTVVNGKALAKAVLQVTMRLQGPGSRAAAYWSFGRGTVGTRWRDAPH